MTTTDLRPAQAPARRRSGERARWVTVAVLVTSALAWAAVASTHGMPWTPAGVAGPHAGHGVSPVDLAPTATAGTPPHPAAADAGTRLLGWTVMVLAMMLPPALPLLRVTSRLVGRRRRPAVLVAVTALAFVAVWTLAGALLVGGQAALGALVAAVPALARDPQVVSGTAAVLAGAYQLSPWKDACLTACRSPLGLAMTTWSGRRPAAAEAALVGVRYGAVCVGCCWGLMLVTVAVGALVLPVMVLVALLMALERLCPEVRGFVPAGALVAVGIGLLLLAGLLPAGLT